MKSKHLHPALIFILLLLSVFSSGCKPDNLDFGIPVEPQKLISVEVTPSSPSMAPGTNLQLEAIGTFSDNTKKNISRSVEWTSANSAIAAVSSTGMVAASPSGLGPAVITATSGSITDSTTVTVSALASIAVTPGNPVIAPGTRQQVTATGMLQNSAVQDLTGVTTWTSSDTGIATVTGPGFVSASSQTTGSSIIAAMFSAVTGTTTLTVAPITSIAVTPADVTIAPRTAQQFTATAVLSSNKRQNVTEFAEWNAVPSEIFAISGTGLGVTVAPGAAIVTASLANADGSAVVTVAEPVPVSISIVPDTGTLPLGADLQFAAFVTFQDGSIRNITQEAIWISSNLQLAFISNTAGSKGLATPLAAGTVTITATFFGISSPSVTLTVTQSPIFSPIVISPVNPIVRVGNSMQFTALSFSGVGPDPVDITAEAVWSSSDETVVFVSQGLATALRPGFATITATFGHVSVSTFLTVTSF